MENVIGTLIVITFIALIAYSGLQNWKQEEKLRLESIKQKRKRDKAKLIIQKEAAEIFRNVCKEVIYKHRFALLADRKKLIFKDSYGRIKDKGWDIIDYRGPRDYDKEPVIVAFANDFVRGEINENQEIINLYRKFPKDGDESWNSIYSWACRCFDGEFSTGWNWLVDQINYVCDELENKNSGLGDTSSMDGIQYEQFCKKILEDAGWVVEDTPTSRDQGVDLIASIENLRVCIQCKCFTKPVGNKAV